jgi:FkbM family methyltransferase
MKLDESVGRAWAALTWPRFSLSGYRMVKGLLRRHVDPRTVIDVGANVGQFAVAASKLFTRTRVYAFEPLPECFERLQRIALRLEEVQVFPWALGDAHGQGELFVNTHSHSSSLLPLGSAHLQAFPHATVTGKSPIEIRTLDEVVPELDLADPVLLKLDVQGYESKVLRGAESTLRRIDHVVIETSFRPMYDGEWDFVAILDWMRTRGFAFVGPVGWLMSSTASELVQIDALFERRRER